MLRILRILLLLTSFTANADNPSYAVANIPEPLRTDVNVVIRKDEAVFKILSRDKATRYIHQVITIFNAKGKDYASHYIWYNKLIRIRDVSGTVYDAAGKQIKKLKNSEIYDQSAYDGFSLYSDARFKSIDFSQGTYPYTVEFEYEVDYKYLFQIPGFALVTEEKVSVEASSYSIHFPDQLAPRYRTTNTDVKPIEERTREGFTSYTWTFKNVLPIKFEPHSKTENFITTIKAAPSAFEYDGYYGTMNSWDEFGRWILSLNHGRNILHEATKAKLKKLTETLATREEKIKAVYEYLQSKTRYVSIQLGIGGYQPFEASVVDEMGYGDCKALSNYTVAMLEAIGIKAHYVLIEAGDDPSDFITDFPSSQFNHAIVAVPNESDTIWLECTSQTNPFGYQGSFTGNRKALLITDNGAKVVNTLRYLPEQNLQTRTAEVVVDIAGDATANVHTTYSGLQYENNNLHARLGKQYDEQRKWVQNNTRIPNFDISSFAFSEVRSKVPSAKVNLDLKLKRYATVSGKRIFLTPNLMNRSSYIPEKSDNRKTKVVQKLAFVDVDTILYKLPEGVHPEFLPGTVKLNSRFGEYEANFKVDAGKLTYIRRLKFIRGEFPAESYNELIDFYKGINKADNIKMVFMTKT